MAVLIVVDDPQDWPLELQDVEIVRASDYLVDPRFEGMRRARVFNLCRSHRYQSLGYYVSLLGAARGHRPVPSLETLQDLRLPGVQRTATWDLDKLVQRSIGPLQSDRFTLSIYFGRSVAKKHDALARALHGLFPAPLLRAHFSHADRWVLTGLGVIPASEIPDAHREVLLQAAADYFGGRARRTRSRRAWRHDLALLVNPDASEPPSDDHALERFEWACRRRAISVERIGPQDYGRIAEFDALFIRETTAVNHHTFRLARRAEAEGLVVVDDPASILRCSNKVFLAELLLRHGVPTPRTMVCHAGNTGRIATDLGLPCVLKTPDGCFSQGVAKVDDPEELAVTAARILERSELFVAQEFMPTEFDWRIGVLDGEPLFACRYHMARRHWQIIDSSRQGESRYGAVEAVDLTDVPARVLSSATRAANLIGRGLYGVDLKHSRGRGYVIEVNDNPNLESECEDRIAGRELWDRLARFFVEQIERRGDAGVRR